MDYFKTLAASADAEFKDRGSRFLAYAFPVKDVSDFKSQIQDIKKDHPKAVHHCFAYRIGFEDDLFRVSDDGEPSGTAGRPILGQIDSKGLTNVAVVVVRYFGGTLLGVPGLINAYKTVTSLALQVAPVVEKAVEVLVRISCTYQDINEVMMVIKANNGTLVKNEQSLFCNLEATIPKNRSEQAIQQLEKLYQVEAKLVEMPV